jgi:hypothetical protein
MTSFLDADFYPLPIQIRMASPLDSSYSAQKIEFFFKLEEHLDLSPRHRSDDDPPLEMVCSAMPVRRLPGEVRTEFTLGP